MMTEQWTISITTDNPVRAAELVKLMTSQTTPPATSLAALIALVGTGGKLVLPAGTLKDTAALPKALELSGAGMGKTVLDCTGLKPTNYKAVLVVQDTGCVIGGMTLKGAAIVAALGQNAAGVRDNGPGVGFTLRSIEITGCQNGILTFASDIDLDGCNIHDNGAGDGQTHELYIGGSPTTKATIVGTTVKCGPGASHALKSRAGTTTVARSKLTGTPAAGGTVGGSVIDISNGGLATITDTDITLAPGAANHTFIGFGMEANLNAATGANLTLNGVRLHGGGVAGSIETKISGATLVIGVDCTFDGTVPPSLVGWGSGKISGAFKPA